MSMIQVQNLVKTYPMGKRKLTVLNGVNLNIEKGELVAIMGHPVPGRQLYLTLQVVWIDLPQAVTFLRARRSVV